MRLWHPQLSIRSKILALVLLVVVCAMATYLALAISLFRADKLAYVYDLNATLARTLAEELESANTSMAEKLRDFAVQLPAKLESREASDKPVEPGGAAAKPARGATPRRQRGSPSPGNSALDATARRFFGHHPDVMQIEVWQPGSDGVYARVFRWYDADRLAAVNLQPEQIEAARRASPLPWSAVLADKIVLENSSLAPDVALLSLAILAPDGRRIVVGRLRPDRFLRIMTGGEIYTAFLVDRQGEVTIHPDPALVLEHRSLLDLPIVKESREKAARRSVRSFESADGREYIGAFSRIDSLASAVVTMVPTAEALAGARYLVRKSVLFASGILCLCVLVSVFFSRQLVAPLRKLELATARLSAGDFDVAVEVGGSDEVAALGAAFNHMTQELRDREHRLDETHQQLLQSSKLAIVGEMAAGISHEVKNPMVGMRGFAQLGRRAETIEEAHEYFDLIEKETTRASAILENLLKFARKNAPTYVRLKTNDLVQDAVRLVHHQLQTQGVRLQVELAADTPEVLGDPNQLQQVLLNLMINAEHAMQGDARAELFVSTKRSGAQASIVVRDTGVGMSSEVKAKLFRAFHTTKANGTGLGLSVSQRIISEHRGTIEVESELGMGSTFTILLPAAPASEPERASA